MLRCKTIQNADGILLKESFCVFFAQELERHQKHPSNRKTFTKMIEIRKTAFIINNSLAIYTDMYKLICS